MPLSWWRWGSDGELKLYQILAQTFLGKEIRLVRHPLSPGRKKDEDSDSLPKKKPDPLLDDTLEFGSRPREKRNTTFTRVAREKLRRAGEVAEEHDPNPNHWVFLTGTLPGSLTEAMNALADHSGYAVKALKDWLKFLPGEHTGFYCWERQKRGALHIHYCVHVPNPQLRTQLISQFKSKWISILDTICIKSGVDLYAKTVDYTHAINKEIVQATAQEVRKSVGRYIAKYASKEAGKDSNGSKRDLLPPRRWWGSSQNLKDLVISNTNELRIQFTSWLTSRNAYLRLKEELENRLPDAAVYVSKALDCDSDSLTLYLEEKCKTIMEEVRNLIATPSRRYLVNMQKTASLDSCLSSSFPSLIRLTSVLLEREKLSKQVWKRCLSSLADLQRSVESNPLRHRSSMVIAEEMMHLLWKTYFTSTLGAPIPKHGDAPRSLLTLSEKWRDYSRALRFSVPSSGVPTAILETQKLERWLTERVNDASVVPRGQD